MEYVGRRVKKEELHEQGTFSGSVKAFEPTTGLFNIVYDDGDYVELGLSELHALLEPPPPPSQPPEFAATELWGNPTKRRRCVNDNNQGMDCDHSINASGISNNLIDEGGNSGGFLLNLNKGLDLNDDGIDTFNNDDNGGIEVGGRAKLHGLDLNERVNLELNGGLDLNIDVVFEKNTEVKKEIIDLNGDVNGDFEKLSSKGKKQSFDLNLELMEDEVMILDDYDGRFGGNEEAHAGGHKQSREEFVEDDDKEFLVKVDGDEVNLIPNVENKEENLLKNWASGFNDENVAALVSLPRRRGRRRKDVMSSNVELASPEMRMVDGEAGDMKLELESRDESLLKGFSESVGDASASRGRIGRKKKELSGSNATLSTPETGLRRSSRRAKSVVLFGHDLVSSAAELDGINHQLCSPTISAVSDEKVMVAGRYKTAQCSIIPPKVELPPSSSNLDHDGVSAFDFLSVYAFLRSFSTFLFLSPFELDEFVESVKYNDSTLLFDSVHVSLMRILRKHLVSLSNEGSVSASNCLRSLNWDFMDLITWPMFVFEYLLLHSPGYIPGLDLRQSKPFQSNYYKLPVSAKVEILRHLSDDVVEVEVFRLELNKRTLGTDRDMDLERNKKLENSRKRKAAIDVPSISCVTQDGFEEPADWNSDECCLCKMDGNLICCDGCPAAFHSRCVGVISSLLPEGDWYCPECMIKDRPWMKIAKSIRGAELLGIDTYGRRYHSSFGYLLVSESCEDKYSYWSYNNNDIPTVIEVLESSPFLYGTLIRAICKHWNIIQGVGGVKNNFDARSYSLQSAYPGTMRPQNMHLTPSKSIRDGAVAGRRYHDNPMVPSYSCNTELENAYHVTAVLETGNLVMKMDNQVASSEGSAEVSQNFVKKDTLKENVSDSLKAYPEIPDDAQIPVDNENHNVTNVTSDVAPCNNLNFVNDCGTNYINYYEFAREASSVFEELASKSSGKISDEAPKSVEEIIAGQLRAVSKRFTDFSWSNILSSNVNYKKEKCGWCFYCKFPEMETDCLFITNTSIPTVESFTSEALDIGSRKSRENHLINVMCHMICIEDHLQGLLLGPWLNPHHSMLWRKSVAGVADVSSLKPFLLMLESNLHHRALSADWRKHVDSVATLGSASHIVWNYPQVSSKNGIGRKKASRFGLCLFWWRGGTWSRKLFNWKVLPHSLASKAARQGGCKKIPGVLYPETGDNAKRAKYDSWRAAVESSRSVDQLALQIRELDANIRWDDIGNTKTDKDAKKSLKSFRKVIVRKKCSEGLVAKYLLDFGKRRFIPDVVVRHGTVLDESSSNRKKYWLEESHVPLHLLKGFEEKRIARKSSKLSSGELREIGGIMRKPFKKKGFAYLFSKAEKLENSQCGHCRKDVLIREAMSCQDCKGFFHKKHVRKSSGSVTAECIYTCHKCQSGKLVNVLAKKGKYEFPKPKNAFIGLKRKRSEKWKKTQKKRQSVNSENKKRVPFVVPLRRSARYAERIVNLSLQNTKVKEQNNEKQAKSAKGKLKKIDDGGCKKKRSTIYGSYWLNGLQLSKRPDDERLMCFRSKNLLVLSGKSTSVKNKPQCSLCGELEHASELNYLACEACGVWFHGDALDLSDDKIKFLIGFKCYKCLNKSLPVCPHGYPAGSSKSELISDCNIETECGNEDF